MKKVSLNQFCNELRQDIDNFQKLYHEEHIQFPEHYLLELPEDKSKDPVAKSEKVVIILMEPVCELRSIVDVVKLNSPALSNFICPPDFLVKLSPDVMVKEPDV